MVFGTVLALALGFKAFTGGVSQFLLPARLQDFVTLALSIVVEALPFVVLGALVSVAIRLFGPTGWLISRLPKWR